MRIEFDEECPSCKGTGLYVGMAERDGAGVVCHTCKGTGCYHFVREYKEFTGRQRRTDVSRVIEVNPGICVGEVSPGICVGVGNNRQYTLQDFGGMPYQDWRDSKPFTRGMEMRVFTCPAWWYQCADYQQKPDWPECDLLLGSRFSTCAQFPNKHQCWAKFDDEAKRRGKAIGTTNGRMGRRPIPELLEGTR